MFLSPFAYGFVAVWSFWKFPLLVDSFQLLNVMEKTVYTNKPVYTNKSTENLKFPVSWLDYYLGQNTK